MATLKIYINADDKSLTFDTNKLSLKIASKSNIATNGLSFNSSGQLIATRGAAGSAGTGQYRNTAYNCIDNGNSNSTTTEISKVRCNSTVTRKKTGDPDSSNEGICIKNVLGL